MQRITPRLIALFAAMCLVASLFASVQLVTANAGLIYDLLPKLPLIEILDNGTVSPQNAAIRQEGDVYYFTDNIAGFRLAILRDNIILDGQGFTLLGNRSMVGIGLSVAANNTVRNIVIKSFEWGIYQTNDYGGTTVKNSSIVDCGIGIIFWTVSNNLVTENALIGNDEAITLRGSSYNVIKHNLLRDNKEAIVLETATWNITAAHNTIINNMITANQDGASIDGASLNKFSENNFNNNSCGIRLYVTSRDNSFWLNNFLNNAQDVQFQTFRDYGTSNDSWQNSWDNGSQGNYWSNKLGQDLNKDGLADEEYFLSANNTDHHPLMKPFDSSTAPEGTLQFVLVALLTIAAIVIAVSAGLFRKKSR